MPVTGTGVSKQSHIFVDRGDADAYDFDIGDLTADYTWRTLDLSSIITDEDAEFALIRLHAYDENVDLVLQVKASAFTNDFNLVGVFTKTRGADVENEGFVALDSELCVEYRVTSGMDAADIIVRGWLKPG